MRLSYNNGNVFITSINLHIKKRNNSKSTFHRISDALHKLQKSLKLSSNENTDKYFCKTVVKTVEKFNSCCKFSLM